MNKSLLMCADAVIVSLMRVSLIRPSQSLPKQCARGVGAQRGFSLIEISIVTTLMMLIAIIGIPAIQGYVIENKVPRVAEEMQRFVARMKANTNGFGANPYLGLDSGALANALRTSGVVSVTVRVTVVRRRFTSTVSVMVRVVEIGGW